jgi:hypothetical protein
MADRGEISEATVSRWEHETPRKRSLPYHANNPGRRKVSKSKRRKVPLRSRAIGAARGVGREANRLVETLFTDPVLMAGLLFIISAMVTAPSRQQTNLPPQLRT